MNDQLARLARDLNLDAPGNRRLRLAFGFACADRVAHLIEEPRLLRHLATLDTHLADGGSPELLELAAREAATLARGHRGSSSLDGSGHAAVSASNAIANALAGRALDAASYAAYAAVYAYGAYAVRDPQAFESEFSWQVDTLGSIAGDVRARHDRNRSVCTAGRDNVP